MDRQAEEQRRQRVALFHAFCLGDLVHLARLVAPRVGGGPAVPQTDEWQDWLQVGVAGQLLQEARARDVIVCPYPIQRRDGGVLVHVRQQLCHKGHAVYAGPRRQSVLKGTRRLQHSLGILLRDSPRDQATQNDPRRDASHIACRRARVVDFLQRRQVRDCESLSDRLGDVADRQLLREEKEVICCANVFKQRPVVLVARTAAARSRPALGRPHVL